MRRKWKNGRPDFDDDRFAWITKDPVKILRPIKSGFLKVLVHFRHPNRARIAKVIAVEPSPLLPLLAYAFCASFPRRNIGVRALIDRSIPRFVANPSKPSVRSDYG